MGLMMTSRTAVKKMKWNVILKQQLMNRFCVSIVNYSIKHKLWSSLLCEVNFIHGQVITLKTYVFAIYYPNPNRYDFANIDYSLRP